MNSIQFRELAEHEITIDLFSSFNRYQEVKRCWRKEQGNWVLRDVVFTEQWGLHEYEFLVECLRNTVRTGGAVIGAFYASALVGFTSVENQFFGKTARYLQLTSLHISYETRGAGVGKRLFELANRKAKQMGAEKLYISAHSSEESQAFYRAVGCREAAEYNERLVEAEPYDCQLEFIL
ncbi:MAG TPA: GNAT family N-acetyltransferase [Lachnospiraceae bacterium]|nr:GNAT family N-acetyltransferase [Lachnospiraceae bacterium]